MRFVFCRYTLKATPGQKVAAVGYPFTDELKLTVGRFVQPVANYLLFDAKLEAGNSGGPLIDEKGRMIGLSIYIQNRSFRRRGVCPEYEVGGLRC